MKYTQLIIGLLIGTALGGAVVSSQHAHLGSTSLGGASDDHIRQIVRDEIGNDGKVLIDAIQKYQAAQQNASAEEANKALQDPEVKNAIFHDDSLAFVGNPDGTHIIAEFFDYNCPVCHMQYQVFTDMLKDDKELKIIFHEFPIFGPDSDENSKVGFGVQKFYPKKYFAFHQKMMSGRGHDLTAEKVDGYMKDLGFDVAKIRAYAKSDEANEKLQKARDLAQKLNLQGTPSLVIGDSVVPHAMQKQEIEGHFTGPAPQ